MGVEIEETLWMPRKFLILSDEFPYHVTNRSNNKDFFFLPLDELWDIMCDVFRIMKNEYGCNLIQFVLMSNHYHLLIHTPQRNLSECMLYFHREVAKRSNRATNRVNHVFGGRYKWCLIQSEIYYWNSVKYIFRNPVEAQLCQKVEEYTYSSFNNSEKNLFQMSDFFFDPTKTISPDLSWLNHCFLPEQKQSIQMGLRKKIFKLAKDKNRQEAILAEYHISRSNDVPPPQKVLGTF